jgi:hypothetical protein
MFLVEKEGEILKKIISVTILIVMVLVFSGIFGTNSLASAEIDLSIDGGIGTLSGSLYVPLSIAMGIASSDSDSSPANAPVMASKTSGTGRAVLTGDSNWFDDKYRSRNNNQLLLLNSFSWLSLTGNKVLWIEVENYYLQYSIDDNLYNGLKALLIANSYSVTKYTGTITNDALSEYDIIAITNTATGIRSHAKVFANSEIDAIENFVRNGRGLFLAGENPGYGNDNLDPVAGRFGMGFDNVCVSDPTNHGLAPEHPIIHVFAAHAVTTGVSSNYYTAGCPLTGLPQQVIPEVPWGTIVASIMMIIAVVGFLTFPRLRRKRISVDL